MELPCAVLLLLVALATVSSSSAVATLAVTAPVPPPAPRPARDAAEGNNMSCRCSTVPVLARHCLDSFRSTTVVANAVRLVSSPKRKTHLAAAPFLYCVHASSQTFSLRKERSFQVSNPTVYDIFSIAVLVVLVVISCSCIVPERCYLQDLVKHMVELYFFLPRNVGLVFLRTSISLAVSD